MSKTAEEMEQEADDLFNNSLQQPEPEPKVEEPEPEKPVEEPETEQPAAAEETGDSGDEELTLQNAEERIKNAQARMHEATQEAAELRQKMQDLEGKVIQLEANKPEKPEEPVEGAKDYASLESLREDYPELINPLTGYIGKLENRLSKLETNVETTAQNSKQRAEEDSQRSHEDAILKVHSDAFDIAATDDFKGWIARQPHVVQMAVRQGTSEDVIWALDQYKQAAGQANTLAEAREASSPRLPKTRKQPLKSPPKFTREQIGSMSPDEYEKHEKDIDQAMANGQIT